MRGSYWPVGLQRSMGLGALDLNGNSIFCPVRADSYAANKTSSMARPSSPVATRHDEPVLR
jgi:hypothetical protein